MINCGRGFDVVDADRQDELSGCERPRGGGRNDDDDDSDSDSDD